MIGVSLHEGRTDARPEQVGMDAGRLQLLDAHFADLIESGRLQGASYLVARNGSIVVHKSQGKRTFHDNSDDLMPESVRKIYSITKVITAVAVVKLCEEGKLYLHQPVASLIPEFDTNLHKSITIWHLLTHTSGLRPDPGVYQEPHGLPWYEWWAHEKREQAGEAWNAGEWMKLVLAGRTMASPGEQWNYCTAGYAVLGEIISRASGMPYEKFIAERIAKPLVMERSFFTVPELLRHETCFTGPWEEKDVFSQRDLDGLPPRGGNGYYSTLEDLWKIGQAILNGGTLNGVDILGRRSIQTMVTNQLRNVPNRCWGNDEPDMKMALGWSLERQDICSPGTYSHEGYGHCGLYVDPVENLVFVYFVPSKEGWLPEAVINPRAIVWSALL
jgi:CubicO group peptidase (beta-lactamase class C family)